MTESSSGVIGGKKWLVVVALVVASAALVISSSMPQNPEQIKVIFTSAVRGHLEPCG